MGKISRKTKIPIRNPLIAAVALMGVLAAAQFTPALAASDLAKNWKGKTVLISVGYKPGGGADTMARLLAVHLTR